MLLLKDKTERVEKIRFSRFGFAVARRRTADILMAKCDAGFCCVIDCVFCLRFIANKMADREAENSKRQRGGTTSPRIPQLVPKQSTGGLLGCLKATIKFRFIAYILAQPPSCLFLLGLSLLAFCLWPLGVYITYSTLPNLDVMLVS